MNPTEPSGSPANLPSGLPSVTEELTAYLDGELDIESAQRVERRLSSDDGYLAEMQTLQQTWDLFEHLPLGQPDPRSVGETMEMVAEDAAHRIHQSAHPGWRWTGRCLTLAIVPLLLFVLGFSATRRVALAPHRELVNHWLLVENLDSCMTSGLDVAFVTRLAEEGLFAESRSDLQNTDHGLPADLFDSPLSDAPLGETDAQVRKRIDGMASPRKNELRRRFEQYKILTPSQKQDLQEFFDAISNHPNHRQIVPVMNAYHHWLRTLGVTEQSRLINLQPIEKRLAEISTIKSRQARATLGRSGATKLPTERDVEYLFDWYKISLKRKENSIRKIFPESIVAFQRQNPSAPKVSARSLRRFADRQPVSRLVALLVRIDRVAVEDLLLEEIHDFYLLQNGLSQEARLIFDQQSPAEQKELVLNWIEAASQAQATLRPDQLQQFFEQLPVEERDELDKMAPQNWLDTLTAKYWQHHSARQRSPASTSTQGPLFDKLEDWEDFLSGDPW